MIVVADTSPLRYPIVLQQAEVLRDLFQRVVIPEEVWPELRHP
jgi:predicted nucleic acid-binding protein